MLYIAAVVDKEEWLQRFDAMVVNGYEEVEVVKVRVYLGISDVIGPAETGDLRSIPATP